MIAPDVPITIIVTVLGLLVGLVLEVPPPQPRAKRLTTSSTEAPALRTHFLPFAESFFLRPAKTIPTAPNPENGSQPIIPVKEKGM